MGRCAVSTDPWPPHQQLVHRLDHRLDHHPVQCLGQSFLGRGFLHQPASGFHAWEIRPHDSCRRCPRSLPCQRYDKEPLRRRGLGARWRTLPIAASPETATHLALLNGSTSSFSISLVPGACPDGPDSPAGPSADVKGLLSTQARMAAHVSRNGKTGPASGSRCSATRA